MLAGVGGRTIAEAKQNLTYREFRDWVAYRDKYGHFDINRRLERGIAMILHQGLLLKGGKSTMQDHMVFSVREEVELTLEEAMRDWR